MKGPVPNRNRKVVEFPVLVPAATTPLVGLVVPLIGVAHGNSVAVEGPQFFDEPVVEFTGPLAGEEGMDLCPASWELRAVSWLNGGVGCLASIGAPSTPRHVRVESRE